MDKPRTAQHKRQQRRKRWLIGGGAVAVVVAIAIALSLISPAAPAVERGSVFIAAVKRGSLAVTVQAPGTLAPRVIQWVTAASAGVVIKRLIRPGARVKANTVLVKMKNPELKEKVDDARSKLAAAKANFAAFKAQQQNDLLNRKGGLANAKSQYQAAKFKAQAMAKVYKQHIVSEIDYREAQAQAKQLAQQIHSDKLQLKQFKQVMAAQLHAKQAQLDQLADALKAREADVADLTVNAGLPGIVQKVAVQPGQRLAIGADIARIAQRNNLWAELQVAESQAHQISLGQHVALTTYGGQNDTLDGKVARIDPTVQNGTVEVDVAPKGKLPAGARPGLDVQGNVRLAQLQDATYVNRPAGVQAGKTMTLFKLTPNGKAAVRTKVKLGRVSADAVQILSGLKPGDKVIVSDTSQWDQYSKIRLQ
jgi:multidrug efflux pump subunit AcrA (membrane-fusion protein)